MTALNATGDDGVAALGTRSMIGERLDRLPLSGMHMAIFALCTLGVEIPRTEAVSSAVRPPKKRISTTCALRESTWASAEIASSSATRSGSRTPEISASSVSSTRTARGRFLACSTRMRRMNLADTAKKCVRSSQRMSRSLTNLR